MNGLLGWYGYDRSGSEEPLALSVHQRGASRSPNLQQPITATLSRYQHRSRSLCESNNQANFSTSNALPGSNRGSPMRSAANNPSPSRSSNRSPASAIAENDMDSSDSETLKLSEMKDNERGSLSPGHDEHFSSSSRGSSPKSEAGNIWSSLSTPSTIPEAPEVLLCFWCKRVCDGKGSQLDADYERGTFPLTNGDRHFCSEVCFNQSRRASFKKSKICDWCRHVRPTVSYVDFTDGDHQLQFCSDKCLNQYKMQIFCRETEAHLQLHPHLHSLGNHEGALITPDLWLKDCDTPDRPKRETQTEKDEDEDPASLSFSAALRNSHHATLGRRTQLSCSEASSSPLSFDEYEPVNLSTTQHQTDKDQVPQARKPSPTSFQTRSSRQSEDENRTTAHRYGHSRTRGLKTLSDPALTDSHSKSCRSPHRESSDMISDSKPKCTIRVRQLEEQHICLPETDTVATSISPPPSTSKVTLSGFSGLGGLLMGTRSHMLPGMTPLFPPPPSDIPRPQILPQLLLSHSDLLRLQGLRPPFMLSPPPLHPLSHQPPPPIHPHPQPTTSQPLPPHMTQPNPSIGFPPVTVLLPLPLPVPIPIPIPVPFPFPITKASCGCETASAQERGDVAPLRSANSKEKKAAHKDSNSERETVGAKDKEHKKDDRKSPERLAVPNPLTIKLKKQKESPNSHKVPLKMTSTKKDTIDFVLGLKDSAKADKKERRSILKYTSDVYEINGVFVPREGGWDTVPQTSAPPMEKVKEDLNSTATGASTSNVAGSLEPVNLNTDSRCSSIRKRRSNAEHSQPLTKKKHLLT